MLIVWSCDSPTPLPPCLQNPQNTLHERMLEVIRMSQDSNVQQFYYEDDGIRQDEQSQWTIIRKMNDGSWLHINLINIYEEEEQTEYYVEEARLIPSDTTRQKVLDYQFVVNQDTAYMSTSSLLECRFTGLKIGPFMLLEGYAHEKDPYVSQYRWWAPETGDIITWYGKERYLIQEGNGIENIVETLKNKRIGRWRQENSPKQQSMRQTHDPNERLLDQPV